MLTRDDSPSDPLYLQVKKKLEERVRSGEYAPASRVPSQVRLSESFGVSQITVQRSLQELVDEGLLVARPGSGTYVVDRRQLAASARLKSIGIIFQDIVGGYPLIKPLLRAVREACRELGYGLEMLEVPEAPDATGADATRTDATRRDATARDVTARDVTGKDATQVQSHTANFRGAILTSPVNIGWLHWLQQQKIPYVLLHNDVVDEFSHSVSCNYALGVMTAAQHLFEQGCERPALVTAEETRYSAGQMAIGFQLAHVAAGRPLDPQQLVTAQYTRAAGYDTVQRWAEAGRTPDGVIFASDEMARGGFDAMVRLGIQAPEDVAIIGFGNPHATLPDHAELSMIDSHNERTGRVALEMLEELIEGKQPKQHRILIDPELIVRASSRRR